MEGWSIHKNAEDMATNLVQLFPIFQNLHKVYPGDIIYVDMENTKFLFDEHGDIIKSRMNSNNEFWNTKKLFPINSIYSNEPILHIWERKVEGSQKLIFTQTLDDIKKHIAEKTKDTILIVVVYKKEHLNVCKMYKIHINMDKDKYTDISLSA